LLPVACMPIPYFSTLFHKRHGIREVGGGGVERKMCDFVVSTNFVRVTSIYQPTNTHIISHKTLLCEIICAFVG